ncbi:MAG TPA: TPM domain-containing protein [Edaphobacter sp.]|jgi:uncharacterized protein|nr:TPM domain-containing protein [Edaphobacter sp.]
MKSTRGLSRLLLLLLVTALPAFAEKVSTMPAPTGYIDDYAGVISAPAKTEMEDLCHELHTKTRAQVFLVTVKTLDGEPVETFANQLFAKWKIGEKKTDRGVLMLFAIKDHKRWIEVGYGLEGILNDAKVGDIGRDMVPALRAANYDEAATNGLRQVTRIIADDSGVSLNALANSAEDQTTAPAPVTGPPRSSSQVKPGATLFLAIFSFLFIPVFIVCFLIWSISTSIRRNTATRASSGFGGGSSFDSSDSFGSSSSSSSSSDDSFSGGDGGSSGGGGAGGDW